MPQGFVYIMGSDTGTLYIGVTSDLSRRVLEHKRGEASQFTTRYGCHRLLYYELFDDIRNAIGREKFLKGKTRQKKLDLIRTMNPEFQRPCRDMGMATHWPETKYAGDGWSGCRLGVRHGGTPREKASGVIGEEKSSGSFAALRMTGSLR